MNRSLRVGRDDIVLMYSLLASRFDFVIIPSVAEDTERSVELCINIYN